MLKTARKQYPEEGMDVLNSSKYVDQKVCKSCLLAGLLKWSKKVFRMICCAITRLYWYGQIRYKIKRIYDLNCPLRKMTQLDIFKVSKTSIS